MADKYYAALPKPALRLRIPAMSTPSSAALQRQHTQRLALALIASCLCSCVVLPKKTSSLDSLCNIRTPRWTLDVRQADPDDCADSEADAMQCLMSYGVVLPALSTLVSGSIVILGNSVHWMEYQGSCEDAELQKALVKFKQSLKGT
jgi:hypothetical protein